MYPPNSIIGFRVQGHQRCLLEGEALASLDPTATDANGVGLTRPNRDQRARPPGDAGYDGGMGERCRS